MYIDDHYYMLLYLLYRRSTVQKSRNRSRNALLLYQHRRTGGLGCTCVVHSIVVKPSKLLPEERGKRKEDKSLSSSNPHCLRPKEELFFSSSSSLSLSPLGAFLQGRGGKKLHHILPFLSLPASPSGTAPHHLLRAWRSWRRSLLFLSHGGSLYKLCVLLLFATIAAKYPFWGSGVPQFCLCVLFLGEAKQTVWRLVAQWVIYETASPSLPDLMACRLYWSSAFFSSNLLKKKFSAQEKWRLLLCLSLSSRLCRELQKRKEFSSTQPTLFKNLFSVGCIRARSLAIAIIANHCRGNVYGMGIFFLVRFGNLELTTKIMRQNLIINLFPLLSLYIFSFCCTWRSRNGLFIHSTMRKMTWVKKIFNLLKEKKFLRFFILDRTAWKKRSPSACWHIKRSPCCHLPFARVVLWRSGPLRSLKPLLPKAWLLAALSPSLALLLCPPPS